FLEDSELNILLGRQILQEPPQEIRAFIQNLLVKTDPTTGQIRYRALGEIVLNSSDAADFAKNYLSLRNKLIHGVGLRNFLKRWTRGGMGMLFWSLILIIGASFWVGTSALLAGVIAFPGRAAHDLEAAFNAAMSTPLPFSLSDNLDFVDEVY